MRVNRFTITILLLLFADVPLVDATSEQVLRCLEPKTETPTGFQCTIHTKIDYVNGASLKDLSYGLLASLTIDARFAFSKQEAEAAMSNVLRQGKIVSPPQEARVHLLTSGEEILAVAKFSPSAELSWSENRLTVSDAALNLIELRTPNNAFLQQTIDNLKIVDQINGDPSIRTTLKATLNEGLSKGHL